MGMFYVNNLPKIIATGIAGLAAAEVIDVVSNVMSHRSSPAPAPEPEETDEEMLLPFLKLAKAGNWKEFVSAVRKKVPGFTDEEIAGTWQALRGIK